MRRWRDKISELTELTTNCMARRERSHGVTVSATPQLYYSHHQPSQEPRPQARTGRHIVRGVTTHTLSTAKTGNASAAQSTPTAGSPGPLMHR